MNCFKGPGFSFELGVRTYIMGILNVTPDSFSDGGRFLDPGAAVEHALRMQEQGADIIDIGAESTRPGHTPVSAGEELERLAPVLRALSGWLRVPVSVDTSKPEVARASLEYGAAVINDVNGFLAPGMARVVARSGAAAVIMHPGYEPYPRGAAVHVKDFLTAAARKAMEAGIDAQSISLDPGVGFGKTYETNLELIRRLEDSKPEGFAFLVGISRKSVVGKSTGNPPPEESLAGTLAAHTIAIMKGADIIRVHDVKEGMQAAKMADAICRKRQKS